MDSRGKQLGEFAITLAIVIVVTYLASNFIGLSRSGFDSTEILNLQTFYLIGGIFAFGIFLFKIAELANKNKDSTYGNSIGFSNIGEKPHSSWFKRFKPLQLVLISILVFGTLAFLNMVFISNLTGQSTYTSVGFLEEQQFTASDSIIYTALLIPGAENLGFALMIAATLFFLGLWVRKKKIDYQSYVLIAIVLCVLLGGLFGMGNHFLRYSGFEISLITVFFFWALGGLLTVITGSFIPFWIMHVMNNLFLDLGRFYSNESTIIFSALFLIGVGILYWTIYKNKLFGRNNET